MKFYFLYQLDQMDCGPTCLHMISRHYGKIIKLEKLRSLTEIGKEGVNLLGISNAAEKNGYRTMAVQISSKAVANDAQLPCILHWQQNHFVVLYKVKSNRFYIADPAKGLQQLSKKEFDDKWLSSRSINATSTIQNEQTGIALLLFEPTPAFYTNEEDNAANATASFSSIIQYVLPYKKLVFQLLIGLLLGSLLQLIFPFLTQSIVDVGVNTGNLQFVYIVLFAQMALFAGRLSVEFIRGWILYHISSRINISILTDFLIKLMKLPVSFFDSKQTGDIMQRMNDHHRIQNFLTGTSLNTLFSLFSLVVFSIVLAIYNLIIFVVFALASALYIVWILVFLKKRKRLDYKQFDVAAAEQSKTIQIVQGMQEIKLHGCEKQKRWEWEKLQAKIFRLGLKGVALNQWQQSGAFFINEGKNIIITFLSAQAVINGQITLGGMLAIQYITGQLNAPIEQMIQFVQSWQLAKISLDRLNEIHNLDDEEPLKKALTTMLPSDKTIVVNNLSFTYPGAGNAAVLDSINLVIPQGKITAIVGSSGSGKSTLIKLLLKFYETQQGNITIGNNDINNISHRAWRQNIGVVMQESFIFSDSIAANIAIGEDVWDYKKLTAAATTANILSFIESLPLGFNTKIGAEGNGISAGQKQRILIARAVYKNPDYIFFDEATNSLDANNELVIIRNLNKFLEYKTAIVVAHRLSTVKNAGQIVVLNNGKITECGTHTELTKKRGEYYTLVKNQLELGE